MLLAHRTRSSCPFVGEQGVCVGGHCSVLQYVLQRKSHMCAQAVGTLHLIFLPLCRQVRCVCCSELQCVQVSCSVLQCVAVSYSELQCVAVCGAV